MLFVCLAVLGGCDALVPFKYFCKIAGIVIADVFCDLVDEILGVVQQPFGFFDPDPGQVFHQGHILDFLE